MVSVSAHAGGVLFGRALLFLLAFAVQIALLQSTAHSADPLQNALASVPAGELLPGADGYGAAEQDSRIVSIVKAGKQLGYAFLNTGFDSAIGYSGKPIQILVGLDNDGRITGAKLVDHSEPIVLAGIPEHKLISFIDGYKDLNVVKAAASDATASPPVDIVSGATVTVLVIDDSIRNSAVRAARLLGLGGLTSLSNQPRATKTLITSATDTQDWVGLIGEGSVRRLKLTVGEINEAFEKTGNPKALKRPEPGAADDVFIELFAASLAVPAIARSLVGDAEYGDLQKKLKPGEHAFLFMGSGPFSFKGSGYVRGGIFDRIQLVQDRASIRFRDRGHKRLGKIRAEGAPRFREVGIFKTTPDATQLNQRLNRGR